MFCVGCYDSLAMRLLEHEGKVIFERYGIPVPRRVLVTSAMDVLPADFSKVVLKAQVHSGDRKKAGGILFPKNILGAKKGLQALFGTKVSGEEVTEVLVEERLEALKEYYIGITYDTETRGPVLALSTKGGTGITTAHVFPVDALEGVHPFQVRECLVAAHFSGEDILPVSGIILKLWSLFVAEQPILAEINPLIKTKSGFYAVDSKIDMAKRRVIEAMGGDIAILASGGGASFLGIDALLSAGGKPANYTEYSGNPPAHVVADLTKKVLSQPHLTGCWVVGGTANFTDIFETIRGFVEGLRQIHPKPTYPIVIRRDGPRQKEAFEFLRKVGKEEGFDFHLFGSETPMVNTAKTIVDLAHIYKNGNSR